jgi:endonuclease YncB( thermonuclease family)
MLVIINKLLGLCFLSLLAVVIQAAEIAGRVVGVTDGDSITVLDSQREQHKIRLQGIDAPELKQPFGQRSKAHLSQLIFNRFVTVHFDKRDRYGRIVGKVLLEGLDVNLKQVEGGLAWHYKDYEKEQSLGDRILYAAGEVEARTARRGLWSSPYPTAPWDFRRVKRK